MTWPLRVNIATKVANTNDERWQWKKTRNKNDRKDTLKMAQMTEMDSLPTVHMPLVLRVSFE